MIKPLRDIIAAIPLEERGMVGLLHMPANDKQALGTHRRMLVLYAGPTAKEQGCEAGAVIHASERWGEEFVHRGRVLWIGRTRDINGLVDGVRITDLGKYLD